MGQSGFCVSSSVADGLTGLAVHRISAEAGNSMPLSTAVTALLSAQFTPRLAKVTCAMEMGCCPPTGWSTTAIKSPQVGVKPLCAEASDLILATRAAL